MDEPERRLKALMLAARGGNEAAYSVLLRELAAHLRAYYRRRLGGRSADAEDLVQETLIAVHTKSGTYDDTQPFTPWLHAIARYKLIDQFRRNKQEKVSLDDVHELVSDSNFEAAVAGQDVERLLARLPQRARLLLRSVKVDGLSTRDAAALSGMSESAVKVAIHRAMRALSAMLNREEP